MGEPTTLIEGGMGTDIFVSGIHHIERLSGGMRIVFQCDHIEAGGRVVHFEAARLVCTNTAWPQLLRMISKAMGDTDQVFLAESGSITPLN